MLSKAVIDETEEQRRARVIMVFGFIGGLSISGISFYDLFVRDDRSLALVWGLIIAGFTFIAHSVHIRRGGKPIVYLLIFLTRDQWSNGSRSTSDLLIVGSNPGLTIFFLFFPPK